MKESEMVKTRTTRDRETAAWISCVAVTIAFTVYWLVQIQDVRELLAMAYG